MSVRASFVERFGEDQAAAIEAAAEKHENGINSVNKGSDPFKWACLIAIGYQCAEVGSYREEHGITAPWGEVRQWLKESAELHTHNGDCDYLALMCGKYNEYMPEPVESPDA